MATVATYGDVEHTFVERKNYKGSFLPGYAQSNPDTLLTLLPAPNLLFVDHIVGNQPDNEMVSACDLYISLTRVMKNVSTFTVSGL